MDKALYVVSGEAVLRAFGEENAVPFNEAMCEGDASADIFGGEFVSLRVKSLETTEKEYRSRVLLPLEPFFALPKKLRFVFGADMFCAVNLLTLAAFLANKGYRGETAAYILNDETDLAGGYSVFENITENAWSCYEKLLLSGQMPDKPPAFFGEENAARYLDYKNGGKIAAYIATHRGEDGLLAGLMSRFADSGLGDIQYLTLIK